MSAIVVETPGFVTTVQDLGRPGHAAFGVSASGAADPIALRIGNRLVGNGPAAAALEMTLVGGTFVFEESTVVALTGASAGARLGGRAVHGWRAFEVPAGVPLRCGPLSAGARSYLCVRGGIDVPLVLGSASTHLTTGLGGHEGRALRAGDRLALGAGATGEPADFAIDPSVVPGYLTGEAFRVTEGPQRSWFAAAAWEALLAAPWRVSEACDRMGLRLDGPPLAPRDARELVTEGVVLGAIQVPAGGAPIVLFVEHQTTGGYPKIASVITADLARLGQLRPRDGIRFEAVGFDEAIGLARAQADALEELGA